MLSLITQHGNRNHNPFKNLIKKLEWFVETNQLSVIQLLNRLNDKGEVSVPAFAKFLHEKVEKSKDIQNIESYVKLMDIDKDGMISQEDLQTCLLNINSDQFYKNGGQNLKQPQFNAAKKFYQMANLDLDKHDPKIREICR